MAGNFTQSGHLDLAVAEPFIDAVTVLLGNGDGTFTQASTISFGKSFPFVPSNMALVAGDFRNIGRTDLAVASTNPVFGDTLDVLLGNGDGTFQAPNEISLGSGVYPMAIVAGDFTGTGGAGPLDLATADFNGSGTDDYSVFIGNGDGTFQPADNLRARWVRRIHDRNRDRRFRRQRPDRPGDHPDRTPIACRWS